MKGELKVMRKPKYVIKTFIKENLSRGNKQFLLERESPSKLNREA